MILWKKSVGESREDSVCGLRELVIALFLNVLSATLTGPPSDKLRREMKTDRQKRTNTRQKGQISKGKRRGIKKETSLKRNKARTSVRIRFGSPFSSKVQVCGRCLISNFVPYN